MYIPSYFEFAGPAKLLSGEFALENIVTELKLLGASRPMVLSDRTLEKIGSVDILAQALKKGGVKFSALFTDIPLDSSITVVNGIAEIYRNSNSDSIIALGGGSVLDTAKGLRMLISQGGRDILGYAGCETLPKGRPVPFVAIPTTSGTGSEATGVAVIKDEERKLKLEFISPFLLPDVAVLDPRLLCSMPPRITALTGLDAFTHAIEAYSCLQKNPISQSYAIAAIRLITEHLPTALSDPKDRNARLAMADAAFIAGSAFSNSMVGIVHAIGHSLGAACSIPHGEAMTILLPACMRYNLEYARKDYSELLMHIAGDEVYAATRKEDRAEKTVEAVCAFINRIKSLAPINTTLHEAKVGKSSFEQVARRALNDGALIVNPRDAGMSDILNILSESY